jgi:acetylornithine deacetylase/succinyl-diaminopimelate desuccinylase-like protein
MGRRARFAGALAIPFLLGAAAPPSAAHPSPDFDAAAGEATALLQAYLRIDTTNPPGRERAAADFFHGLFEKEGIASEIIDLGGGRANVLARLRGTGALRPIILLNHLDVVPADASRWTVPPFSGEIRDGFLWGRGATDMKGTAVCQLLTMFLLKRSGMRLDRDVLFLGTADEEEGGQDGVRAMVAKYRDRLENAELVLTEGATISVESGRTTAWNVDVTEKSILWLRLAATGKAGHASIPEPDGAVGRLVRAVGRLLAWEPPVRLIPAVDAYFRQLSRTETGDLARALSDPKASLEDPERRALLLSDPERAAYLRPTISVTGLSGSDKVNVIPGRATATLDCRLLPGDDPDAFRGEIARILGDPSIAIEVLAQSRATASPVDTPLFRAIEKARDRFEPGVPILTPPLTSTTDATELRAVGMVVYGFEPFRLSDDDDRSHGDDERLSLANLRFGLEVTYAVVADAAGARR